MVSTHIPPGSHFKVRSLGDGSSACRSEGVVEPVMVSIDVVPSPSSNGKPRQFPGCELIDVLASVEEMGLVCLGQAVSCKQRLAQVCRIALQALVSWLVRGSCE